MFSNDMSISDYTKSGEVSGKKTKTLSDVAKKLKLEQSPDGSIVIDNKSVERITNPLERQFPDSRYRHLGAYKYKLGAAEYDVTRWALSEAKRYIPLLRGYLYDPNPRKRMEAEKWLKTFNAMVVELEPQLQEYTRRLVQAGLVLCQEPDDEAWYFRHSAPCDQPFEP